jgi:dolichyl-phosphate-mannose--protein O-mannosyl transferase
MRYRSTQTILTIATAHARCLGDNWKLEFVSSGSGGFFSSATADAVWKRTEPVRLQHIDTGKYLHSHRMKYGHPIPGQLEVTAVPGKNEQTVWIAEVRRQLLFALSSLSLSLSLSLSIIAYLYF